VALPWKLGVLAGVLALALLAQACHDTPVEPREDPEDEPEEPGVPFQAMAISAGERHVCALAPDSRAYCWGDRDGLGTGDWQNSHIPVPVSGGRAFMQIAAGGTFTCGLTEEGRAFCWGSGDHERLGNGSYANQATPVPVLGDHRFVAIAVSSFPAWGMTREGGLWTWGLYPVEFETEVRFLAIEAGSVHTCGLTAEGVVYCWGAGSKGRLGDGNGADQPTPVPVWGNHVFVSLSVGIEHSCALTAEGDAYCWGFGHSGQVGNGEYEDNIFPGLVRGGLQFSVISAGWSHTCGLTTEGRAYCWGRGVNGRLGNDSTANQTEPVPVSGDLVFATISAGKFMTCALKPEGGTYCWGAGTWGVLGNGSTEMQSTPVPVSQPLKEATTPYSGLLEPPSEMGAEVLSMSEVRVSWTAPPLSPTGPVQEVDSYPVYRRRGRLGEWSLRKTVEGTEVVDKGLEAGTVYWYRVFACVPQGCSRPSEAVEVETPPAVPGVPEEFTLELVSATGIHVGWEPPDARVERNELDRREDGGPWERIAETYRVDFMDTDVRAGPGYGYRVRACNVSGCSPFTAEAEMRIAAPEPPGGLSVEEYAMREFRLAWEVAEGVVAEYALERQVDGVSWEEIGRTQKLRPQDLEYYDDGLSPETTYGYRVLACNVFGCSEPSAEVVRATPPDVPPVEGRLVVPRGYTGGDANVFYLHIVEDVNDLANVRTVFTPQSHWEFAVQGTELWITSSGADLLRIEMTTGETVQQIGGEELIEASGLSRLVRHLMVAPRPGGGVLLSKAQRADNTWGTAVFDASFSELEIFIPFVPWAGVAFDRGGEEKWYLLGTRTDQPGEEIEVMVVTGGRLDEARYFPLGEYLPSSPGAMGTEGWGGSGSEQAAQGGTLGKESFVVDPAGVAYIAHWGGVLHRVSAVDGSHQRLNLPPAYRTNIAVGPEYVYILPRGNGLDFPGPATVYRVRSDFAGGVELFASLAEEERFWLNPEFTDIAVGPEGKRIYVAEGTWNALSLFGFRELRVYAFDVATGRLIERPRLGGYGRPYVITW